MIKILNKSQAEAVYSAMCALNNIGSVSSEFKLPNDVWVLAGVLGGVTISTGVYGAKIESHSTQANFASAYGL